MPRRPSRTQRWLTAATWPVGIAMTSWDYMWRSTPLHRGETTCAPPRGDHSLLSYPAAISAEDVQGQESGHGPLFHRRYRTRIRQSQRSAHELMRTLTQDLNRAAPTTFARFQKVLGDRRTMAVGDEYVVRMPGPWDGPVRVIGLTDCSFRLATLEGHLEAGQIEFRALAGEHGELVFEIESWARSSSWLSNLLYHKLRMAKEVQAHMWISFLEGVASISGGRMTGGVEIRTERTEDTPMRDQRLLGPPRVRRKLAQVSRAHLNFDPTELPRVELARGWVVTDICQPLPGEPPGMPLEDGSWQIATQLMRGYEFADPSIVRAYYDPGLPLRGRTMLLKLQALGVLHLYVGVRVGDVYEYTRASAGREARVWGWDYRTLEGHVEIGQMAWEVWKWLDTGQVEFRAHSISRTARIVNPFVRLGFHLLRAHERTAFLDSTKRRMETFVDLALERGARGESIREAAARLIARRSADADAAHDELARRAMVGHEERSLDATVRAELGIR